MANNTQIKENPRSEQIMSVTAAAKKIGCSHTHLRLVLRGERKPSQKLKSKIRILLGITL